MPRGEAAWMAPNGLASLVPKGYMGRGGLEGERGVFRREPPSSQCPFFFPSHLFPLPDFEGMELKGV